MHFPPGTTEIEITESELFIKALTEPMLCMLINPNLTDYQLTELKKTFHVKKVEYDNKWHDAVVLGYYKPKIDRNPEELAEREARIVAFWNS